MLHRLLCASGKPARANHSEQYGCNKMAYVSESFRNDYILRFMITFPNVDTQKFGNFNFGK